MTRTPYRYQAANHKQRRTWLVPLLVLAVIASGLLYWFVIRDSSTQQPLTQNQTEETEEQSNEPAYTPIDLQPTIDTWVQKYSADYHIAVFDLQAKKIIGENEPDTVLFAASLYKIYIAYLTLKDFQTGAQDPNEIITAGQTKKECVDKMIRESDSPCGEAMMADIGQSVLNQRVQDELGMTGTFFNGIRTSARDSALISQYIADKRDLNDENTVYLLDAMLTQPAKFKRGLQTGAPEAIWHTKVGWNEDANYHDIGIMTLPDGRKFAVAILGQGSGASAPIADFAKTIYSALK